MEKKIDFISNEKSAKEETLHRARDIEGDERTLHWTLSVKELSHLNSEDNSALLTSAKH